MIEDLETQQQKPQKIPPVSMKLTACIFAVFLLIGFLVSLQIPDQYIMVNKETKIPMMIEAGSRLSLNATLSKISKSTRYAEAELYFQCKIRCSTVMVPIRYATYTNYYLNGTLVQNQTSSPSVINFEAGKNQKETKKITIFQSVIQNCDQITLNITFLGAIPIFESGYLMWKTNNDDFQFYQFLIRAFLCSISVILFSKYVLQLFLNQKEPITTEQYQNAILIFMYSVYLYPSNTLYASRMTNYANNFMFIVFLLLFRILINRFLVSIDKNSYVITGSPFYVFILTIYHYLSVTKYEGNQLMMIIDYSLFIVYLISILMNYTKMANPGPQINSYLSIILVTELVMLFLSKKPEFHLVIQFSYMASLIITSSLHCKLFD